MKQTILVGALLLTQLVAFSQTSFVPGYFITADGQRTDCQIRVKADEWRDNPKGFEYRATENAEPREADVSQIVELGFVSGDVFKRIRVEMDRSPYDVALIERNPQTAQLRSPAFQSETLFLRLLISGKASLYQYDEGNLHRFFYSIEGKPVTQLVYKRYLVRNRNLKNKDTYSPIIDPGHAYESVALNEDYKQQLFNDLKCKSIDKKDIQSLEYDADKLKVVFLRYNECMGGKVATYENNARKSWTINFSVRLGIAMNPVEVKTSVRLAEVVLPKLMALHLPGSVLNWRV